MAKKNPGIHTEAKEVATEIYVIGTILLEKNIYIHR